MTAAISSETLQRLAGSLLHFLWQGGAIAAVAGICLRLLAKRSAELRYVVACCALLLMLVAPILTFAFYAETAAFSLRLARLMEIPLEAASLELAASDAALWTDWVVAIWFSGVTACSFRLLFGWIATRRVLHWCEFADSPSLCRQFEDLNEWFGLKCRVRLLIHATMETPVVIGWIRPAIVLPVSALTNLSEAQMLSILAHELAHIRRHDYLVNVLQRGLESVFFYHPAVWWVSARIRAEREDCCDDLAVQVCGDRLLYAQTLLELERARESATLVVAATQVRLRERIGRILGRETVRYEWQSAAAGLLFVATLCLVGVWQSAPLQAVPVFSPAPIASTPLVVAEARPGEPITRALTAIAAIVAAPQSAQRSASQTNSASIEGVVVKAGTQEGLGGAVVELTQVQAATGNPDMPKTVFTGADGRFAFRDLPPGGFRLVADIPGGDYHPSEYGQKSPRGRGTTIRLTGGQAMRDVHIDMLRTGAISGRITNARGEPVVRARVMAMEMIYRDGQPAWNVTQAVQTDDRGRYRLFWLSPGKYYVAARAADVTRKTVTVEITPPGRSTSYEEVSSPSIHHKPAGSESVEETDRSVFYGNVVDAAQAAAIDLAAGAARDEINISLALGRVPSWRVSGVVLNGQSGQPAPSAAVRLVPRRWSSDAIVPNATADRLGAFDLGGVLPGSYTLYATSMSPAGILSGRIPVDVAGTNLEKLQIRILPGAEVRGAITVNGDSSVVPFSSLRVTLTRGPDSLALSASQAIVISGTGAGARGTSPIGAVAADGSFNLQNVSVGDYRLNIQGLQRGGYVQSARADQVDVLKHGVRVEGAVLPTIQIVIATDAGTLEGAVTNSKGERLSNSTVALVPELIAMRENKALYHTAVTDMLGQFRIDSIPPGDYRIFGWEQVQDGAWEDDEFIRRVELRGRSVKVTRQTTAAADVVAITPQ